MCTSFPRWRQESGRRRGDRSATGPASASGRPAHRAVSVVIDGIDHPLQAEDGGYFRGIVDGARRGNALSISPRRRRADLSRSRLALSARWSAWRFRGRRSGVRIDGAMAIGAASTSADSSSTRCTSGRLRAKAPGARRSNSFGALRDIGINLLEVMPVHEFPGRFGWGYDGVDLWAPTRLYGTPDDFRAFVDAAHAHGLGVILDVVYNHFGPDGCYLRQFTPDYFTKKYVNDWGDVDQLRWRRLPTGVREFFAENAAYWIDEFHLDGLRLDATQSINDASEENVLALIVRRARAAASEKAIFIVGENEPQEVKLIDEYGLDALWNDDWHHAAMVAATGRREAYYTDYRGTPQEFVSMAQLGFLYQGQYYSWQKDRARNAVRCICRRRVWFVFSRITIRSRTRRAASGCNPSPARAAIAR